MDIQNSAHLVKLIEASHWHFLFSIRNSEFKKGAVLKPFNQHPILYFCFDEKKCKLLVYTTYWDYQVIFACFYKALSELVYLLHKNTPT